MMNTTLEQAQREIMAVAVDAEVDVRGEDEHGDTITTKSLKQVTEELNHLQPGQTFRIIQNFRVAIFRRRETPNLDARPDSLYREWEEIQQVVDHGDGDDD